MNQKHKVIHPFTFMPGYNLDSENFNKTYTNLIRGTGSWVVDDKNKEYLYLTTAVPTVGLGNHYVIEAMEKQMKTLSFGSTCTQTHSLVNRLATKLTDKLGNDYSSVFFSNDGSGAVETAMKLAREYFIAKGTPKRTKFISLEGNYHGTTFGSGSVTQMGIKESFGPGLEGCLTAPAPNLYRPSIQGSEEEIIEHCVRCLENLIIQNDPDTISALLLEPVQGVFGVVPLPKRYIQEVRDMTKRYGILLIMDEVTTGIGRTGFWLASHELEVTPDFVAISKGLTGGYFPMGATLIIEEVASVLYGKGGIFLHGSTQSGHPTGCAAALAVLDIIESSDLIGNTKVLGQYIIEELNKAILQHPFVGDIRGKGLMMAIEFVKDKETKESIDYQTGERLSRFLHEEGILGNFFNGTLLLYPPLNLSYKEANYLINGLVKAIKKLD